MAWSGSVLQVKNRWLPRAEDIRRFPENLTSAHLWACPTTPLFQAQPAWLAVLCRRRLPCIFDTLFSWSEAIQSQRVGAKNGNTKLRPMSISIHIRHFVAFTPLKATAGYQVAWHWGSTWPAPDREPWSQTGRPPRGATERRSEALVDCRATDTAGGLGILATVFEMPLCPLKVNVSETRCSTPGAEQAARQRQWLPGSRMRNAKCPGPRTPC